MSEQSGDGPSTILVAVDGSETSLRAAAYAAGMARRQHGRLVCLYVRTVPGLAAIAPGGAAAVDETHDEVAQEIKTAVQENAARLGVDARFLVREGNPYTAITELASELHADAVMVGASMQPGHRIVGSLASHLVRAARWPVTVVP
jgi:nucleotide-binding universal stress UspA family protein